MEFFRDHDLFECIHPARLGEAGEDLPFFWGEAVETGWDMCRAVGLTFIEEARGVRAMGASRGEGEVAIMEEELEEKGSGKG